MLYILIKYTLLVRENCVFFVLFLTHSNFTPESKHWKVHKAGLMPELNCQNLLINKYLVFYASTTILFKKFFYRYGF